MSDTALVFKSATEMAALIREGKVTSVQLVQAHLRQIQRWNSQINAVVTVCEAEALRDAEAADRVRQSGGKMGALHGVPITIKDGVRVRGVRSTFGGLPPFLRHVPRSDSPLIAPLREAGAIFIGRTNLPLMALDWQCHNPFFKEGLNPWDVTRTPGGSSGGAAAALAAGFTPLELGSDLGGSIRYPAHCCGVLGLRTTDGLLPLHDMGPEGVAGGFSNLLSFGPMARSIPDLRLMLDVLTAPSKPQPAAATGPLRIAVTAALPGAEPNAATTALVNELVAKLRRDGHDVQAAAPDVDMETGWRVWGTIAGYEFWNAMPPLAKNRATRFLFESYMLRRNLGEGPFLKWMKTGIEASEREYQAVLKEREEVLRRVDDFFGRHTLWLLPVAMGEAIRTQPRGTPIEMDGKAYPYSVYLGSYTVPTTAFGTPVLTAPIGFGPSGLPIGIQIHGARFSDRQLLDAAEQFLTPHITVEIPTMMR